MYRKILIVDSDDINRQLVWDNLGKSYDIIEVETCEEAITYVSKFHRTIGLVIVGFETLHQSGYSLITNMNKNALYSQIPVACIGNHFADKGSTKLDEKEAIKQGAIDFFAPPFDFDIIHQRIENLIALRERILTYQTHNERDALKRFDKNKAKGTFWNPDSIDSLIMRAYVGPVCILETVEDRISVLKVNDKFLKELLNETSQKEHVIDENPIDYIEPSQQFDLILALSKAASSNRGVSCDLSVCKVNSNNIPVHIKSEITLIDKVNERCLFYCTIKNDTEQWNALRRERSLMEQLQVIIENVSGGVSATTIENGKINYIYANDEYYSMFGYTKEQFATELPGGIYDLIHPDFYDVVYAKLQDSLNTGEALILEYKARKRDKSIIWIRSHNSICRLNSINDPVYITVLVDISNEKKAKDRIELINQRLGDSEIFIKLDITNKTIEEYHSIYETEQDVSYWKSHGEIYESRMLSAIYRDDKEKAVNNISFEGLEKHYQNGDSKISLDYRRYVSNGAIHWFRATAILIEGIIPGTVNAFIYSHDIDIEKKEQIARETVIDTNIDTIITINIANRLAHTVKVGTETNSGDSCNYEEKIAEFIKEQIAEEDSIRATDFFSLENIVASIAKRGYADFSFWLVRSTGESRRKYTRVIYLDSTHEDLLMVGRDITQLFEKERDQRIKLQVAVEAANEASNAKSDFLSRMSHDMRTPLNAIIGLNELARQENNVPEIDKYLKSIENSSQYLLGLINDTLDLSKIESGNLVLHEEPYPLEEFLLGLNTVIRPLMDAKNIEFNIDIQKEVPNIIVDKLRFTQVFYNLLSNAAKFTPEGGKVDFTTCPIDEDKGNNTIRFVVRDNGIGMSKQYQKVLFDPFTQEDRAGIAERRGTGLGLAIVKRIIDATHGTITVNSELGRGTEFVVELSMLNDPNFRSDLLKPKYDPEKLKDLQVLLVDDAAINVVIATKVLEAKGCIVEVVHNGLEALEAFKASPIGYYSIIMTDIRMPVMDGLEEARQIRALQRKDAKTIPIIATTADAYTKSQDKTKAAGINSVLVKPVISDLLYQEICKLV